MGINCNFIRFRPLAVVAAVAAALSSCLEDTDQYYIFPSRNEPSSTNYINNGDLTTKVASYLYEGYNVAVFNGTEGDAMNWHINLCNYFESESFVDGIEVLPDTYCTFDLVRVGGDPENPVASRRVVFQENTL